MNFKHSAHLPDTAEGPAHPERTMSGPAAGILCNNREETGRKHVFRGAAAASGRRRQSCQDPEVLGWRPTILPTVPLG